MLEKAPDWKEIRSKMDFSKMADATQDPNFNILINRVNNKEYLYWDRFKQIYKLTGLTAEGAWTYIRMVRFANSKRIALVDTKNIFFLIGFLMEFMKVCTLLINMRLEKY